MLRIDAEPTFTTTVKVNTKAIQGEFDVEFLALPTDELEALDTGEAKAWRKVLERVVRSFGPVEVAGQRIDSVVPGDLQKLIRWPGVGPAMLAAYYNGLWSEAQGN